MILQCRSGAEQPVDAPMGSNIFKLLKYIKMVLESNDITSVKATIGKKDNRNSGQHIRNNKSQQQLTDRPKSLTTDHLSNNTRPEVKADQAQ
jgi:hypothetical protein